MSEAGASRPKPLDPEKLFRALAEHDVKYVLVGALAARLQGFPRLTADAEITPAADAENLDRLARALRALGARVFTESVPEKLEFDCSPEMLSRAETWSLVTETGRLYLIFTPPGTRGYDDLARTAAEFRMFGVSVRVASLEDLIRSKEAADRPQDRQDVVVFQEMVRRRKA